MREERGRWREERRRGKKEKKGFCMFECYLFWDYCVSRFMF